MNIKIRADGPHRLIARLKEGDVEVEVIGWGLPSIAANLQAALDDAELNGYGECFWPEPTGQYWWMFKRDDRTLEVAVLWSRSSAVGWQGIFRATDEIGYVRDLVRNELSSSTS